MFGPDAIRISSHFDFDCNWGDPDLTCADLVLILGEMADEYNGDIIIAPHDGAVLNPEMIGHEFESWHAPTLERNEFAMAADIFVTGSILEAYFLALKYFSSIGFYPTRTMDYNDSILYGSLHVDLRKKEFFCDCHSLWWNPRDDKYEVVTGSLINDVITYMQRLDVLQK